MTDSKPLVEFTRKRGRGRPPLPDGEAERRARERQLKRRLEWKSPKLATKQTGTPA